MSTDGDPRELTRLLFRQHQVISRRQALRHVTAKGIRSRLESGRWWLVGRGVYLAHDGLMTRQQVRWIAVLATGAARPAVLAGLSALELHGLRGYESGPIHVLIPARSQDRLSPAGVVVHRTSQLPRADIDRHGQPPCTGPARSLVDAAQWAGSDDQARAIVAAGLRQRLVSFEDVMAVLDRMPRARRRLLTRKAAMAARLAARAAPSASLGRLG